MIRILVDFALSNRFVVLSATVLLVLWGAVSFHNLPVEAYPDIADNYVTVITQWPGRAAEEVEQQVTIPVETEMNGIPHLTALRSESIFGLSFVLMIFDDQSQNDWNREKVLERLTQVNFPPGLQGQIGTDWSTVGQIYWYTLHSSNPKYDLMELKSIQDWTLEKQFKSVKDIVDISTFGGTTKEFQVRVDPNKLVSYGLSIGQVEQQLANNNTNAGGSFVEIGEQQMNVRALGLYRSVRDIANTVLTTQKGTALRVKDVADVAQGPRILLGAMARADHLHDGTVLDNSDVIQGVVLMRKGADAQPAMDDIHEKVKELNERILPEGVKIVPMLDRADLLHYTLHTVLHNMAEGMILVTIILFLFLGNARGALIVALTIPFALLFASICLDLSKIPANLLSLGALDFGMVVDGAVVMVENIVRHMSRGFGANETNGAHLDNSHSNQSATLSKSPAELIREACHEVQRPVFFAIAIIITAYLPIFTLERVEGKLFKPMAWTVAFALLGAMTFSILIAPVLSSLFFRQGIKEWHNPIMVFLTKQYRARLRWAIHNRKTVFWAGLAALAVSAFLAFSGIIGSEFLPHLDEGAIWARGSLSNSTSLTEGKQFATKARLIFASFPEVTKVVSEVGRPDDGTDTGGFGNTEYFVDLKPKDQWRPVFRADKNELIAAMNREVSKLPGVFWNFSQPIEDNVDETLTGTKGGLAVKVYGNDLKTLEQKGEEVVQQMSAVPGVKDIGLFRDMGQPNLEFVVDRQASARFGINVADIQDAVQTAVGGNAVSQVLQGEARYDVVVRYKEPYRNSQEAIANIRLLSPSGERVSLAQLTKMQVREGAYDILREANQRYVAVRYEVRERDLGTTVNDAMTRVQKNVQLPRGYHIQWSGENESQKRSSQRLMIIVPLTVLVIFIILYSMFRSAKWACLILSVVTLAPLGGLLALLISGTHFSVSTGVGFLALWCVRADRRNYARIHQSTSCEGIHR